MVVMSLYDLSGVMVRSWAMAGYECFIVDIQHPKGCTKHSYLPNTWKWGVDILTWLPPKIDYRIVFSFSPCDDTAVSGARWFVQKGLSALGNSINLFARGIEIGQWSGTPWCAEHPVSTISTYYRGPDRRFDPADYAGYTTEDDNYNKLTHIWHSEDFIWPKPLVAETPPKKDHILDFAPSGGRKILRSKTPDGFARAVFLANDNHE